METTEKAPRRARRTKLAAAAMAVALAGSLGAVALFDNAGAAPGDNVKYTFTLTAGQSVPPTTDPRTATGIVMVKSKKARVCVLIKKMGPNTNPRNPPPGDLTIGAHLHGPAPAGENQAGFAFVIQLNIPTSFGKYDKSKTCVDGVDPALITALKTTPNLYYVDVHTADFPSRGAIRGQLAP